MLVRRPGRGYGPPRDGDDISCQSDAGGAEGGDEGGDAGGAGTGGAGAGTSDATRLRLASRSFRNFPI